MLTTKQRQAQGKRNRDAGKEFEDDIGETFEVYAATSRAFLDEMPVPTKPIGRGMRVCDGKAPFDVYGYAPTKVEGLADLAVFVGAELKTSDEHSDALPIVKAGNHGKGIAQHQLEALALVAKMGGHARIVWNNGGIVGVLGNARIIHHQLIYEQSLASELRGKGRGSVGSRSIPWEAFTPADFAAVGGKTIIDWLKLGE